MATVAVARSGRLRRVVPAPGVAVAGLAGVVACIAVLVNALVEHPEAAEVMATSGTVVLAVAFAVAAWLVLAPPRGLTSHRVARWAGAAGAALLVLGFLRTTRMAAEGDGSPLSWVVLAPPAIFPLASVAAALVARSFRAGVQAAIWTALLGAPLVFAIGVPEAMHQYGLHAQLLLDGEGGESIGTNLNDFVWVLIALPLLGLPFGVIGTAVAGRLRRGRGKAPELEARSGGSAAGA
jgi:hypothetical protein